MSTEASITPDPQTREPTRGADLRAGGSPDRTLVVATFHSILHGGRYGIELPSFLRLLDSLDPCASPSTSFAHEDHARSSLLLRFDDGLAEHDRAARELESRGFAGVFFVSPGLLDQPGYLTSEEVRRMSEAGHSIQSHSWVHAQLTELAPRELRVSLAESRERIQELAGRPVLALAPPGGVTDTRVTQVAQEVGYRAQALMTWGVCRGDWDMFALPCIPMNTWTISARLLERARAGSRLPLDGRILYRAKQALYTLRARR